MAAPWTRLPSGELGVKEEMSNLRRQRGDTGGRGEETMVAGRQVGRQAIFSPFTLLGSPVAKCLNYLQSFALSINRNTNPHTDTPPLAPWVYKPLKNHFDKFREGHDRGRAITQCRNPDLACRKHPASIPNISNSRF